jgi:hypothetical protein
MGQAGITAVQAAAITIAHGFCRFGGVLLCFRDGARLHCCSSFGLVVLLPKLKKGIPSQDETPFAISSSDVSSKQVFWLSAQPG